MDYILHKTYCSELCGVHFKDLDLSDKEYPYSPGLYPHELCIMRFCTQCYSRSWGIWRFQLGSRIADDYLCSTPDKLPPLARFYAERDQVLSMDRCPICGESLNPEHRYMFLSGNVHGGMRDYPQSKLFSRFGAKLILDGSTRAIHEAEKIFPGYKIFDFESLCTFVDRNMHLIATEKGAQRLGNLISNCENTEPSTVRYRTKNSEQLKVFLRALVEVETNIYAVSERLKALYPVEYVAEKDVICTNKVAIKQFLESEKKAEKKLKELRAKKPTKGMSIEQIEISLPEAPVAPTKPQPPIIRKPGLFNKKRVLAENAMLTSEYEKACAIYEEESRQHQIKLIAHGEIVRKLEEDRRKRYQARLNDLNRQHQALVQEQEKKLLRAKEAVAAAEKAQANALTPKAVGLQSVKLEIQQAEDIFRKLYAARRDMYMSGVVFPKYHNLVAISSFYEYVCSGRCESLDGVNGAYNIYENEIRMNAVISQLSQVIEKLDAIKEGQYVLYSAISKVNGYLFTMNKSMDTMNASLARMDQKLTNIDKNAEVVAYNSAVTACYTKKNAELTDALGYLIALK